MKKTRFNIVVATPYTNNAKQEKVDYTNVGVAFLNEESETLSCKIKPGISISGEFVLFKHTEDNKK